MLVKPFTFTGLAAVSSAHMIMTNPVPYAKSSLNNSPLDASGSDFPCKMRNNAFAPEGANNVFPQGSTQELQFQGSAVHGGGSCQVSITTDAQPSKDSKWKVIKSIEGGCPAKNTAGNLAGGSPNTANGDKYEYTIPKEMPAGNYTLAWTWFNKVGNREMYMNCAPLSVTGSDGSKSFMQSLPDMMVANLKSQGDCATKEGTDVQFPNPGKDVDRPNGDGNLGAPQGSCGSSGGGGGGSGPAPGGKKPYPTSKPGNGSPTGNPGLYPPPSQPTGGSPSPQQPGGGGYPNGGSPKGGSPKATTSGVPGGVFIPTSKAGPAATSAPATPTGGPSPAGGFAPGTPCTSEGNWNCVGGSSFQRCASGTWSPVEPMSAGMTCTPGESTEIKMALANSARRVRRALHFAA